MEFGRVEAASAKAQVLEAYGAMAKEYSTWVLERPFTRGLFEEFVAALAELRGRDGVRVLDVASGSGEPAATLARFLGPQATVHATDAAPQMVELATARCHRLGLPNVVCERADAEALTGHAAAAFDAVTCCMGIMFVPDVSAALAEFHRVLKLGGLLAVSVFQGMDVQPFYGFLGQLAAAIDPGPAEQAAAAQEPPPLGPCRFADPAPLLAAAAAAGLADVRCRELRLAYFLGADEWWDGLAGLPDTPLQPALERAHAKAGGGDVEAGARQLAEGMLRERGWLQADGSVLVLDNRAWFVTARKEPV